MGSTPSKNWIVQEVEEVNLLRRALGLSQIESGEVKCLHCSKDFFSRDKKKNRLCFNCVEIVDKRRDTMLS